MKKILLLFTLVVVQLMTFGVQAQVPKAAAADTETTLTATIYDSWSASTTVNDIHVQVWNVDQTQLLAEQDCVNQKFTIVLSGDVPSTVVLKISAPGYKTLVVTKNLNIGQTNTWWDLRLEEGSDPEPATYTVSGTVKDENGNPVEGVDIYATLDGVSVSGPEVKTDAEGKWSFPDLAEGTYNFRAMGPDWYYTAYNNGVVVSADVTGVDFTLEAKSFQIAITVWDKSSLGKVSGAHVQVWTQDETPVLIGEGTTTSSGTIPSISVKGKIGTYTIKATAAGYADFLNDAYKPTSYSTNRYSIMMEKAYTVSGIVKDEEGAPVVGAEVYVNKKGSDDRYTRVPDLFAETAEDGSWSFQLGAGDYQFQIMADGYLSSFSTYATVSGADVTGVETVLSWTTTRISGTFYDADSFAKIKEGHIEFWTQGENPVKVAEADGNLSGAYSGITLKGITGTYDVVSSAPGYATLRAAYTPKNGQSNTYSPMMEKAYTVSGTVKDDAGNPVEGVDIYASLNGTTVSGAEVKTDAEGKYSFPGLAEGTYNFRAMGPDWYRTAFKNDVEVSADVTGVDFVLETVVTPINATVYANDGTYKKLSGVHVQIWTQDETPVLVGEGDTNSSGQLNPQIRITGQLGTYTVKATAAGYADYVNDAYKPTKYGQSNVCTIMMDKAYTVSGVIKNEDGENVADAEIFVSKKGSDDRYTRVPGKEAKSAADGSWSMELGEGDYQFQVMSDGYKTSFDTYKTVSDADVTGVDITLQFTVTGISGTFYDADDFSKIPGGHIEFWTQGENPVKVAEADGDLSGNYPMVTIKGVTGTYDVKATAPGYEPYAGTCKPNNGQTGNKCSPMMTALSYYTASGTVKDKDGNPVEGVTVALSLMNEEGRYESVVGVETKTDAQGAWTLADLVAGKYSFRAMKDGYKSGFVHDVELTADKSDIDFVLEFEESTILGSFFDAESMAKIPNGHIEFWTLGENPVLVKEANGFANGSYPAFKVVGPFQTYLVKATAPGYEPYEKEYTPQYYGMQNNCSPMLTPLKLTFTATVSGNQEDGSLVKLDNADVKVTAIRESGSKQSVEVTNEGNGFYSFNVAGPDALGITYEVKVSCEGYTGEATYSFSFDGEDVEHEFVLNQLVGIDMIMMEIASDKPVYTVDGLRVRCSDIRDLAPGIYVIGDRKVIVK